MVDMIGDSALLVIESGPENPCSPSDAEFRGNAFTGYEARHKSLFENFRRQGDGANRLR
jgi:hypothetical protein